MSCVDINLKVNVDASEGVITKYLPDATLDYAFSISYKKIDLSSNTVLILPTPGLGQLIDGLNSLAITTRNQSFTLYNKDGQWWVQ